jgi:flagellar biosynthesis protein FlhG
MLGSGKGGAGKSVLSVALAAVLAQRGLRTLLVDGDQDVADLHRLLGVTPRVQAKTLLDVEVPPVSLVQAVDEHLWLLAGESGDESRCGLGPVDRAWLHHRFSSIYARFDVVIVDAGSGLEGVVRASMIGASRLVVVTAPEPAALTDAFVLVKIVTNQMPELPIDVLVNRCLDPDEGQSAYGKLATACAQMLNRHVSLLASVADDPAVRAAVRQPSQLRARLRESAVSDTLRAIPTIRLTGASTTGRTA